MISIYYNDLPAAEKARFFTDHLGEATQSDWLSGKRAITHSGTAGYYQVVCDVPLSQVRADSGAVAVPPSGVTVDTTSQKMSELERKLATVMVRADQDRAIFESRFKAMEEKVQDLERRKSEAEVINENLREQAADFSETITDLEDELAEARKHEQIPKAPFDLYEDAPGPGDNTMIPPPPLIPPNISRMPSTAPYITYSNSTSAYSGDSEAVKEQIIRNMANRMLKKNL